MSLTQLLQSALSYDNVFERIIEGLERQTPTEKGRMWEDFCQRYLRAEGYEDVWMLREVPSAVREKLGLGTQDVGIDIVVHHKGRYQAVQCKYRKRQVQDRKTISVPGALTSGTINGLGVPRSVKIQLNRVGWKELSTFYALCARTAGPWERMVVMTTAKSVGRKGNKTAQDKTYAYRGFETTERKIWLSMAGSEGHQVGTGSVSSGSTTTGRLTSEELRAKRLEFYGLNS
jgi:hypothetical protein